MAYVPTKWENAPSTSTPLNADNLNKLEQGVKALHDALDSGELKGEKVKKAQRAKMVKTVHKVQQVKTAKTVHRDRKATLVCSTLKA